MSDHEPMTRYLEAAQVRSSEIVIPGNPRPKGRPRFTTGPGHAYTDGATQAAEESIRWQLRSLRGEKYTGLLSVSLHFYRDNHRRVDIDNLQKLVLDACNGYLWDDDSQIAILFSAKLVDKHRPRTVIRVEELQ